MENTEYVGFARRVVRRLAGRIGEHGMVQDLSMLAEVQAELDAAVQASVDALREQGFTWAQIAEALGVTRQAAQQRYGRGAAA